MELTKNELAILYLSLSRSLIVLEKRAECPLPEAEKEKIKVEIEMTEKLYMKLYNWGIENLGIQGV